VKRQLIILASTAACLGSALSALCEAPGAKAPVIKHTPITLAAPGQPITVRAAVTDASSKIKSVTLFYATSRDAAPFRTAMTSAGADLYLGTIPATQLTGMSNATYYIEAINQLEASSETPWYSVRFQGQAATGQVAAADGKWSWKTKALVGAGAAMLIGGGIAVAAGGGGGGGGGGGTATTNAGTFAGSVTTVLELDGSAPTSTAHAVTFTVFSAGLISSDTLQAGQHLEAPLSNGNFEMVANAAQPGLTGSIRYIGHLIGNRITGNIDGTARTTEGVQGTFSGTFSATKQ
jgi:hypothetical protein